jgi:drug/metabolite transporter (DMT)-like permease
LSGIALVILNRKSNEEGKKKKISLNYSYKGILYALGGALGQAIGIVLSKYGMGDYDAIAATHIRVIVGAVSFGIIVSLGKNWYRISLAYSNKSTVKAILIGAFFGPFLGVYFSLLAVKYTTSGIASTIMAIVPVLIIPPAIFIFKEKVTLKEWIGAVITVIGVILFFVEIPI